MDLRNYKIQVASHSTQPVIVCVRCRDEVRDPSMPGQPTVARILETATKHEWTVHRTPGFAELVDTDIVAAAEAILRQEAGS